MTATVKEKIFMLLYAGILVLLFLMSSTNLIIKEKKKEVYRVSVIVEDSKDDYYVNLKKGMDQAALEHNIDVNFITLYERNNSEQQKELLQRELDVETQAVILVPVDYTKTVTMLDAMTIDTPVIILNNEEPAGNKVMANISMDYFEAGKLLAEQISYRSDGNTPVYLFAEGLQYGSNRRLYDGLISIFAGQGNDINLIEKAFDNRYAEVMAERVAKEKEAVVIALDTESLLELAGMKGQEQERFDRVSLYGPGATLKILRYMEDGVIDGIVADNTYNAGYISMEEALSAIDNKVIKEKVVLKSFFLDQRDIEKTEYEKMLYPIH